VSALGVAFAVAWAIFWAGWLVSASTAKRGPRRGAAARVPGIAAVAIVVVMTRVFKGQRAVEVHSVPLQAAGVALFACGLGLAVWARVALGRNWGMPMSRKDQPELVTSGPYASIRHPIYSGILLGIVGTALATELWWLVVFGTLGAYFVWSAIVEERLMGDAFGAVYAAYRARTKMLIPFVL
jgi:protein-S-isoprenylcysteine O-methyltransferase Ste14